MPAWKVCNGLLAPPAHATAPPRPRDVFLPGDSRRQSRFGTLRRRLRWPLGVYTTPVAILIVWEILAQAGILKPTYEMARTTGAGPWRVVTRVQVPGALPGFLVGLRFSLAYSILGLVAAETVNADEGLGFLITQAQTYLQTNKVFVGLVIYSILGLLADQFVRILERVLLRWRPSYEAV
jgi:ABC-type proline/glycine betaine transport system permease subunit